MKYLITESKLKSFLKDKFGIDLDGKIEMVTNKWELPMEFDRVITPKMLNTYLNRFGPMFVFKIINRGNFLYQNQNGSEVVVDDNDRIIDMDDFYNILGVNKYLGISVDNLIDLYFKEEN